MRSPGRRRLAEEVAETSEWLRAQHSKVDRDLASSAAKLVQGLAEPREAREEAREEARRRDAAVGRAVRKHKRKVERLFMECDVGGRGEVPLQAAKRILADDVGLIVAAKDLALFLAPYTDKEGGRVDYERMLRAVEGNAAAARPQGDDASRVDKQEKRLLREIRTLGAEAMKRSLRKCDKDADGSVTLPEFREALKDAGLDDALGVTRSVFRHLDSYDEGVLDVEAILDYCFSAFPTEWKRVTHAVLDEFGEDGADALLEHLELLDAGFSGSLPLKAFLSCLRELGVDGGLDTDQWQGLLESLGALTRAGGVDYERFCELCFAPSGAAAGLSTSPIVRGLYRLFAKKFGRDSKAMFLALDRNKSGFISRREFKAAVGSLVGVPEHAHGSADAVFDRFDTNGDDTLSYDELQDLLLVGKEACKHAGSGALGLMGQIRHRPRRKSSTRTLVREAAGEVRTCGLSTAEMRRHFESYDRTRCGLLTRRQLVAALSKLRRHGAQLHAESIEAFSRSVADATDGKVDIEVLLKRLKSDADATVRDDPVVANIMESQARALLLTVDSWTLRRLFFSHDRDGNGELSCAQFANMLENAKIKATHKQVRQVAVRLAEMLGTQGRIRYTDLMSFMANLASGCQERAAARPDVATAPVSDGTWIRDGSSGDDRSSSERRRERQRRRRRRRRQLSGLGPERGRLQSTALRRLAQDVRTRAEATGTRPGDLLRRLKSLDVAKRGLVHMSKFHRVLDAALGLSSDWNAAELGRVLRPFVECDGDLGTGGNEIQYGPAVASLFDTRGGSVGIGGVLNLADLRDDFAARGFTTRSAVLEVFRAFDKNKTGKLSRHRFGKALRALGCVDAGAIKTAIEQYTHKFNQVEYRDLVDNLMDADFSDSISATSTSGSDSLAWRSDLSGTSDSQSDHAERLDISFDFSRPRTGRRHRRLPQESSLSERVRALSTRAALGRMASGSSTVVPERLAAGRFIAILEEIGLSKRSAVKAARRFALGRESSGRTQVRFEKFLRHVFDGGRGRNASPGARDAANENKRLRKELKAFDLAFFEQVEDLKHGYTSAVERNKQLESYIWEHCAETGIPPPIDEALETKVPEVKLNRVSKALEQSSARHGVTAKTKASAQGQLGDRLRAALAEAGTLKRLWRAFLAEQAREGEDDDGSAGPAYVVSARTFEQVLEANIPDLTAADTKALCTTFDKDGDGQVRVLEFIDARRGRSLSPPKSRYRRTAEQREARLTAATDKVRAHVAKLAGNEGGTLNTHEAFRKLDLNNDGTIDRREFGAMLRDCGVAQVLSRRESELLFARLDPSGDGYFSFRAFNEMFQSLNAAGQASSPTDKDVLDDRLRSELKSSLQIVVDSSDSDGAGEAAFDHYDRSGKGALGRRDFHRVLQDHSAVPLTAAEKDEVLGKVDADGDGRVSFDEMRAYLRAGPSSPLGSAARKRAEMSVAESRLRAIIHRLASKGDGRVDLKEAFFAFDKDGDGLVSTSEFRTTLRSTGFHLTPQEEAKIMRRLDPRGSGSIDFPAFMEFYQSETNNAGHASSPLGRTAARREKSAKALVQIKGDLCRKIKRLQVGPSLRRQFARFDRNRSGDLSRDEFRKLAGSVGIELTDKQLAWFVDHIDSTGRGRLTYGDLECFVASGDIQAGETDPEEALEKQARRRGAQDGPLVRMALRKVRQTQSNVRDALRKVDRLGRGFVEAAEFESAILSTGAELDEAELKQLFEAFDPEDHDRVDYGAFLMALVDHKAIERQFRKRECSEASLATALQRFNIEGGTSMKKQQLKRGVRKLGVMVPEWHLDAALDRCWASENGEVQVKEFCSVLLGQSTSQAGKETQQAGGAVFTGTIASLILAIRGALVRKALNRHPQRALRPDELEDVAAPGPSERHMMASELRSGWLGRKRNLSEQDLLAALRDGCGLRVGQTDAQVLFKLMDDSGDGKLQREEVHSMVLSNGTLRLAVEVDEETDTQAAQAAARAEKVLRRATRAKCFGDDIRLGFRFLDRELCGRVSAKNLSDLCGELGCKLHSPWEVQALIFKICQRQVDVFARVAGEEDGGLRFADVARWLSPAPAQLREAEAVFRAAVRHAAASGGGGTDYARVFRRFDRRGRGSLSVRDIARAIADLSPQLAAEAARDLTCRLAGPSRGMTASEFERWCAGS